MMDIQQINNAALLIDEETPPEVAADYLDRVQAFMAAAKEAEQQLKARLVWWIETTGQEIVIGPKRYYVGWPPDTKCTDAAGTLGELFQAGGGDFGFVAGCLSSSAFKYGECRKVLPPEVYARLFVTTRKPKLEEGKIKPKQLLSVDEQFVKPRS